MGDRFWEATERAEQDFTGRADVRDFRRRMRSLGHEDDVIADRVDSIHPDLVDDFHRARPRDDFSCDVRLWSASKLRRERKNGMPAVLAEIEARKEN